MAYPEGRPSAHQRNEANSRLVEYQNRRATLEKQFEAANAELEQKRREIMDRINHLSEQHKIVSLDIDRTLYFLSPARGLPIEIYYTIFLLARDDAPDDRVPWKLASVCRSFRAMALTMPNLWSVVHLDMSVSTSPNVLSLWIARSAETLLDIHITVASDPFVPSRTPIDQWIPDPPYRTRVYVEGAQNAASHARAAQWGHVVAYTLTSCAYRWRSFGLVAHSTAATTLLEGFRFFTGPAPHLESLSIYGRPTTLLERWDWFPRQPDGRTNSVEKLSKVELMDVPFLPSSNTFTNLTSLMLGHSNVGNKVPIDDLFIIISANPNLQRLCFTFPLLHKPVLPVPSLTLPNLKSLTLNGTSGLLEIMESLTASNVEHVVVTVLPDADDDVYRAFEDFAGRSSWPPINHLYLDGPVLTARIDFLKELPALVMLTCGGLALDAVFTVLDGPVDTSGLLPCPDLTSITLVSCQRPQDADMFPSLLHTFVNMRTDKSPLVKTELKSLAIQHTFGMIRGEVQWWLRSRLATLEIDEVLVILSSVV